MEKSVSLKGNISENSEKSDTEKIKYYKQIIEQNGDFNWVNSVYMSTSQTLIDFDDKNLKITDQAREFVTSFLKIARGEEKNIKTSSAPDKSFVTAPQLKNDEKFIKNKTVKSRQKAKLGLLVQYEVETPKILSQNFKIQKGYTEGYIYRIEEASKSKVDEEKSFVNINKITVDEEEYSHELNPQQNLNSLSEEVKEFCILSAVPLVNYIPIKLINSDEGEARAEQYKIIFTKKVRISQSLFEKLIIFHHRLFADLSSCKE
jgi:hypothetical protein